MGDAVLLQVMGREVERHDDAVGRGLQKVRAQKLREGLRVEEFAGEIEMVHGQSLRHGAGPAQAKRGVTDGRARAGVSR